MIEPLSVGIWANPKAGTGIGSRVPSPAPARSASSPPWWRVPPVRGGIVDVNAERLRAAGEFGFEAVIDGAAALDLAALEPDILLECTGAEAVIGNGIRALRAAGRAVLVGMGSRPDLTLPLSHIQNRELTVTGTFRYANTYPAAIALAASGRLRLDDLVGARVPLEESERALQMGRTNPAVLKTIVAVS
jgi:L-iditol 2-dehydrogenase